MENLRSVDKAQKWLLQAEKDDRLVPSMSAEIMGELEAQAAHIAILNNTISNREETIREWVKTAERLSEDLCARNATIEKLATELENRGMHHTAIRVLKEEASLPKK